MGCIGAGHHCFRWNTARIHACSTKEFPLDDGNIHSGGSKAPGQWWPCLPGPNDDGVVLSHCRSFITFSVEKETGYNGLQCDPCRSDEEG
jgi:hypothetical protein